MRQIVTLFLFAFPGYLFAGELEDRVHEAISTQIARQFEFDNTPRICVAICEEHIHPAEETELVADRRILIGAVGKEFEFYSRDVFVESGGNVTSEFFRFKDQSYKRSGGGQATSRFRVKKDDENLKDFMFSVTSFVDPLNSTLATANTFGLTSKIKQPVAQTVYLEKAKLVSAVKGVSGQIVSKWDWTYDKDPIDPDLIGSDVTVKFREYDGDLYPVETEHDERGEMYGDVHSMVRTEWKTFDEMRLPAKMEMEFTKPLNGKLYPASRYIKYEYSFDPALIQKLIDAVPAQSFRPVIAAHFELPLTVPGRTGHWKTPEDFFIK